MQGSEIKKTNVMAGLDPAIHAFGLG